MNKLLFIVLFLISQTLFSQRQSVEDFNKIDISGSVYATLIKSTTAAVDVDMKKGNRDDLEINVRGGELKIKFKNKMWGNSSKAEVIIYYSQNINKIECSAGSKLNTEETISSDRISIDVSSGANCSLDLKSKEVYADVSSGGKITLKGETISLKADASSGGFCTAVYLNAENVTASASSGGGITTTALKSINAETSSGGSVKYAGNPEKVEIDTKLSGSILKM
jgi:hypothetical protein